MLRAAAGVAIAVPMAALATGPAKYADRCGLPAVRPPSGRIAGRGGVGRTGDVLRSRCADRRGVNPPRHQRGHRDRSPTRRPHPVRRRDGLKGESTCPLIVRPRRSPRTRLPTNESSDRASETAWTALDTVTIISNYIPLEDPAGGPNFFEFGDEVLYRINIDNTGDGRADVVYEFRFTTTVAGTSGYLLCTNTVIDHRLGQAGRSTRLQTWRSVTEVRGNKRVGCSATGPAPTPPCNIGPRSTPNYPNPAEYRQAEDQAGRQRHQSVRRATPRRVLRRSRRRVRPCRPSALSKPAPHPDCGHRRSERSAGVQRPHHRYPGSDQRVDPQRQDTHRPDGPRSGDRRLGVGAPAEGPVPRRTPQQLVRALHPGVAAREPVVQRGHRADGRQGPLEPAGTQTGRRVRQVQGSHSNWPSCSWNAVPRRPSRTWPR